MLPLAVLLPRGGNYILNASAVDIANYARQGADLVVEFRTGQRLVIRDFSSRVLVITIWC